MTYSINWPITVRSAVPFRSVPEIITAHRYVTFTLAVCSTSDATGYTFYAVIYLTNTQSYLSITRNIKQSLYDRFM